MRKGLGGLIGIILCSVEISSAVVLASQQAQVAPQGVTDVVAAFAKSRVSIKITTHVVDIGTPSDEPPQKRLSSCTYSRFPCSPIDYLEISVNGNALFVSRSVYADLADVGVASVRQTKIGQFVLTLGGGDASESYTVEITFDRNRVRERRLMSNLTREVMQRTIYSASQPMNH
jgi:hypothetical protein